MSAAVLNCSASTATLPPVNSVRCCSESGSSTPDIYVVEKPCVSSRLSDVCDEHLLINTMNLVEPEVPRSRVPNHLLDTKIYATVTRNKFLEVRPPVLHFAGFEVGRARRLKFDIVNLSADVLRMHIIPPQTKYFRIGYTKTCRMVPGLSVTCTVEFSPDEWRYYYDCVRIHSPGEEGLVIPIHAFPVMNTSTFPKLIDFALVPVGDMKSRTFPLRCEAPINFEFQLEFVQSHPSFTVDPIAGTVPANSEVDITITFCPTSFETATAKLQLSISQFHAKPLVCNVLGRSVPGLTRDIALQQVLETSCPPSQFLDSTGRTLDPGLLSPVARARRRKNLPGLSARSPASQELPFQQTVLRDGFVIPPVLNTPHAVAMVLNQKRGQLRTKDLRLAMEMQRSGEIPMTRQMKESQFEMNIRHNVYEERQNQLCWQVKLGDDPVTSEYCADVLECRHADWMVYKRLHGDLNAHDECCRYTSEVLMRRTRRSASEVAAACANFDPYVNNTWATRHATLTRFQQAVRKFIICRRMMSRLRALQRFLCCEKMSDTDTLPVPTCSKPVSENSTDAVAPLLTATRVSSITFPVYVDPGLTDDLAVDKLGRVSIVQGPIRVKPYVPYFALQVPQFSKLYGYSRFDVQTASDSYVKPVTTRPLRTADEGECSSATVEISKVVTSPVSVKEPQEPAKQEKREEETLQGTCAPLSVCAPLSLCPPPALFIPVEYSMLHIFNPAPGLVTFLLPLPYSETDPDFHFCPLPRFVPCDAPPSYQFAATQKHFLDRQDVIKCVMTWKKLPAPAITATSNVPTLSNVWVPRWGQPFNTELLPLESPCLLHGLDEDELADIIERADDCCDAEEPAVQLTMEMMKAEFDAIETAWQLESATEDEVVAPTSGKKVPSVPLNPSVPVTSRETTKASFPNGNKLPPTNLPSSDNGPVSRGKLEADLNTFLERKRNGLGQKIDSRVASIDQITKNRTLILK